MYSDVDLYSKLRLTVGDPEELIHGRVKAIDVQVCVPRVDSET